MGQTALLPLRRKACWGFFRPKNLNPWSWVPEASMLTTRAEASMLTTRAEASMLTTRAEASMLTARPPKPLKTPSSDPQSHDTHLWNKYQYAAIINVHNQSRIPTDQVYRPRPPLTFHHHLAAMLSGIERVTAGKMGWKTEAKCVGRFHAQFDMRSVNCSSHAACEVLHWQLCMNQTPFCDGWALHTARKQLGAV
jgi:hypothetical protein